jgi:hypothetical protein
MASKGEIEAAALAMLDLEGGYIEPWRNIARAGLEAAERVRAEEKRASCQHLRKVGSGYVGSDGSGRNVWHCPECGAHHESEWPARPQQSTP